MVAHLGALVAQIGDVTGHLGDVVTHLGVVMGHLGYLVAHLEDVMCYFEDSLFICEVVAFCIAEACGPESESEIFPNVPQGVRADCEVHTVKRCCGSRMIYSESRSSYNF